MDKLWVYQVNLHGFIFIFFRKFYDSKKSLNSNKFFILGINASERFQLLKSVWKRPFCVLIKQLSEELQLFLPLKFWRFVHFDPEPSMFIASDLDLLTVKTSSLLVSAGQHYFKFSMVFLDSYSRWTFFIIYFLCSDSLEHPLCKKLKIQVLYLGRMNWLSSVFFAVFLNVLTYFHFPDAL